MDTNVRFFAIKTTFWAVVHCKLSFLMNRWLSSVGELNSTELVEVSNHAEATDKLNERKELKCNKI